MNVWILYILEKRCNKLMKEVQVKCESEKVPEADQHPVIDLKWSFLSKLLTILSCKLI